MKSDITDIMAPLNKKRLKFAINVFCGAISTPPNPPEMNASTVDIRPNIYLVIYYFHWYAYKSYVVSKFRHEYSLLLQLLSESKISLPNL